jgi:two-component system phosphate regulon sensor histidine kinase PhoR
MQLLLDTLLDSDRLDERKVREYLRLIAQENQRLSRLIHNFLAFSRMERKSHTFEFSTVPVAQLIDDAVAAMRERLNAPGCHFEVMVEPNLSPVEADPDAVVTALINLLDNAWKYTENQKHIVLQARAQNGNVLLSVQDNGIGIPSDETKRIFRSFYQSDRRLSRATGGCGLGLSIVAFVVAAHRGSASVESQPGHGSTFTISLPAASRASAPETEAFS